jgi:hypothetical protein
MRCGSTGLFDCRARIRKKSQYLIVVELREVLVPFADGSNPGRTPQYHDFVGLSLEIGDLDKQFARYESSQNFNLVDVGAFFFVGPLGLGITKGFDFARILDGSGGSTTIGLLVSKWQVEHGVAHAMDVAMATPENRVALKGGLDFVSGRFDDVTVALIDGNGCSKVQQKIRGPFMHPEAGQPNVLATLAGPTGRLFKRAKKLLGGKCDVFYVGSVAPP